MEIKGASYLYTLAGLMITFAGLSALLFGLRQGAGAKLSRLDRYIAKTVMTYSLVLTAGALLPSLLGLYGIKEPWIWRDSVVLFGIPMSLLQATYPMRRRIAVGEYPPAAIFAIFVLLGSTVTVAMIGYVLAGGESSPAVYASAVTIDFFTVAYGLLTALDIIMKQPSDRPERTD